MVINTRSISRRCTFNTVSSPAILALFPYVNPHIWKTISASIAIFLFGVPFRFAYLSFLQLGLSRVWRHTSYFYSGDQQGFSFAFWEKELFKY